MTRTSERWKEVSPKYPCPVCGAKQWCRVNADGTRCNCRHEARGGERRTYKNGEEYFAHRLRDDRPPGDNSKPRRTRPAGQRTATQAPTVDLADMATRDAAYCRLIELLDLSADHRGRMRKRGFRDDWIDAGQYRTLPVDTQESAMVLWHELGDVAGTVPGLLPFKIGGPPGLLITVRNLAGQIIALKIRLDAPAADGSRYRYVTSTGYGGPSPSTPPHVPAGIRGPCETVRICEGELKADLAWRLSGIPTVSFAGVSCWRTVLPILEALQARTVLIAFDMDSWTNGDVARQLRACFHELKGRGDK